ncbi:hypothetical protein SCATT_50110 [Streptantibioticus cattleyicolor NRRL 8057 = DSM 46488]|uniref:Uncharacterized protein n=1 Tax=Streptantibioticus cattleyicolor (strain ATCC 35852 / DSM 46488 / JCM 4925 / NBRC 14057 / NRRL 8057) TaxID=1003195 RepID=G8X3K9_STREN|nr:hypothetical protein SCATT_50110 [Streptantibioticus cattleyicolor NRRL 8057 = DSM 46488]
MNGRARRRHPAEPAAATTTASTPAHCGPASRCPSATSPSSAPTAGSSAHNTANSRGGIRRTASNCNEYGSTLATTATTAARASTPGSSSRAPARTTPYGRDSSAAQATASASP